LDEDGALEERPASPETPAPDEPQQAQIRQIVAQVARRFSGPLPPPDVLARYNDAVPNGAERIVAMAERQAEHRMRLEGRVITADIWRSYAGVVAGLVVALAFLYASYRLVDDGHELSGTLLATFDIVGLVGVFVYGTISQRRERKNQLREMTGENESS
jgi:uncharacterized membrane protein